MKICFVRLLFSLLLIQGCLGQSTPSLEELKNIIRNKENLDVIEEVASKQDRSALELLFPLCGMGDNAQNYRITELFADLPGAEAYAKEQINALPHLHENNSDRDGVINRLTRMHRRFALNILGEILEKQEPLTSKLSPYEFNQMMEMSQQGTPNSDFALQAMKGMRLANFPKVSWNTHAGRKAIREWWIANKHQPDSYFFDGSINYAENPPPWTPPDPNAASLPPNPYDKALLADPAPKPPELSPVLPTPPPEPSSSLLPTLVITAAIALSVLFAFWKQSRT